MAFDNKLEANKKIPYVSDFSELPNPEEVTIEGADYIQPKKPRQLTVEDLRDPKTGDFRKPRTTLFDVSFGVGADIAKKAMGQEVDTSDYNIIETGVAGMIDGSLKMMKNAFTLTGTIIDAFGAEGTPAELSTFTKLEKYFNDSIVGKVQQGAEEAAYQDAVGRLSSAFTQLYGGGALGAKGAVYLTNQAKKISNLFIKNAKLGNVTKINKNLNKAAKEAKNLNKIAGKEKFMAIGIGGGIGAGIVVDNEDIGTLGDIDALNELIGFDFPTKLNRVKRDDAKDEALRNLSNRFKFGADTGLISVVSAYGLSKLGQKLIKQGDDLATSDKAIDRWIDKFAAQFRPRRYMTQELFEGVKSVEGKISAGSVTSKDLILDIDKTLFNIAKETGISKGTPNFKRIIGRVDELLTGGQDVVKNGKIIFNGFDGKTMKEFDTFAKEVGLNSKQKSAIIADIIKVRNEFNVFKNALLTSKNVNVGAKEFNQIMSDRMKNLFTSEYKIATDRSILPWNNYRPSESNVNAVKAILQRYYQNKGIKLQEGDLDLIVDDMIKNVRIDEVTKMPQFFLTKGSVLDDAQTQLISIADSIQGGKFKPTELFKTSDDLRAFQRFFGQKRDPRNTIINTINDLAGLVAKDQFYTNVAKRSRELAKNGERAVVYPTRIEAIRALPNQKIIANKNGLQIKNPLGESAYTNPLNGFFTSQSFADALNFAEKIPFDSFAKNMIYRHMFLIPKGATQISKTILGPFTHTRNFFGSSVFAAASGNAFKNPKTLVENFKRAFNTVQPQLIYRNQPKDQALYKFLLEEQVVSSSAVARDISGMLDDIGKGGDVYMRLMGRFGKGMKKLYEVASDLYLAEDDIWKVFNFLGEVDSYTKAYQNALAKGLIKSMPDNLTIMKEAANLVRNYMPNYGYVGRFFQGVRRLPLGNFIAWPAEILRNGYNLIEIGVKESRNPILKDLGLKRLASAGTTIGVVVPTTAEILRNLYGITKDMAAAAREFVPYFSTDSILFMYRNEDGELQYIDASGAYVYDTLTNPLQSVIASIEQQRVLDPNAPLVPGLYEGIARGAARLARPFVEPSIWYATMLDILVRDGVTKQGSRIWNPEAPLGEKIEKALAYTVEATAPGSYAQFKRLYQATTGIPGPRGEEFQVDDEIAGFYGLRGVKLDPISKMPFKLNEYIKSTANARALMADVLKGGEVSGDEIIKRFYTSNQQKFKAMKKAANVNELARILEADEKALTKVYDDRGRGTDFAYMNKGKFIPFSLSEGTEQKLFEQRESLEETFDKLQFDSPIRPEVLKALGMMEKDMYKMYLDERFEDQLDLNDYLVGDDPSVIDRLRSDVQPLPPQPQPNPSIVQQQPAMNMQNGLTVSENALLSDAEKAIRLKQRGIG